LTKRSGKYFFFCRQSLAKSHFLISFSVATLANCLSACRSQGCAKRTDLAHCTRIQITTRYTAYCHAFLYASRGVRICARPLRKYGGLRVTCPLHWVHFHGASDKRRVTYVHVDTPFKNPGRRGTFRFPGRQTLRPMPSFLREGPGGVAPSAADQRSGAVGRVWSHKVRPDIFHVLWPSAISVQLSTPGVFE
jgi:hypothetical protein